MSFNEIVYNRIIQPFFIEINLKNQIMDNKNKKMHKKLLTMEFSREYLVDVADKKLQNFNMERSHYARQELEKITGDFFIIETLLYRLIIDLDNSLAEDAKSLIMRFIAINMHINSTRLENIIDVNIYMNITEKILELSDSGEYELTEDDLFHLNLLRRSLYRALHKIKFAPKEALYKQCTDLIERDLAYSKERSPEDYLLVYRFYLEITILHLQSSEGFNCSYISLEEVMRREEEYNNYIKSYIMEESDNSYALFKIFTTLLNSELFRLRIRINQQQKIPVTEKKNFLVKYTELIKIFYGYIADYDLFFDEHHLKFNASYNDVLVQFSREVAGALKDNSLDNSELIFAVFTFTSNFPEYVKVNVNFYKKLTMISRNYLNKKVNMLSTIMYLKSFDNPDILKKELQKIKKDLEKNPVISLINFYNIEIGSIKLIPPAEKPQLRANENIIEIHEKIYTINKMMLNYILRFKTDTMTTSDKVRLSYLENVQIEMKNIFNIASNPNLITDLGQLYLFFIDSFIKQRKLDYREDLVSKASSLKMQILDLNPTNFSYALLFSKLGKFQLILEHENPARLGIKKRELTAAEKEEIAGYINYSRNILPRSEDGINWHEISNSIENIRKPAFTKQEITPIESRILKVISAVINKVIRQDIVSGKIFTALYEEAYVPAKNIWDLDPILIFYFNAYFSRQGKNYFYEENTGDKLEISFPHINNSHTYDKIYDFIGDLIDKTNVTGFNIESQLEELGKINEESLYEEGFRKNISFLDVKRAIDGEKTLFFEKHHISKSDETYLIELLNNYLSALGKASLGKHFGYILSQLLDNANKANYKREFFSDKKVDFNLKYSIGVKEFLKVYKSRTVMLEKMAEKMNLKIKVLFRILNKSLTVSIINNYRIHDEEIKLIDLCLNRSRSVQDLKQIYNTPLTGSEGEGMGLIISMLFLYRMGLGSGFKINIKENETAIKFSIPFAPIKEEQHEALSKEIVEQIEKIPLIPENIKKLKEVVSDPEATIDRIERLILKDSSITADVLKHANSAYYMTSKPLSSVKECIKILGRKGLENILLISGSYRLLENKISKERMEEIIKHSEETAFYARELLDLKDIDRKVDEIYLASLLHDIGKIIVEELSPDIYEKLQTTVFSKDIPIDVLEDLAGGINHALIGNMIAEKWKYPPIVSEVIRCHHNPRDAQSYADAVFIVYLANSLTHYNNGKIVYENLDQNVLEFLEINAPDRVADLAKDLKDKYNYNFIISER